MSSFESVAPLASPGLAGQQPPRRPGPSVVSGQGRRVSGGGDSSLLPPLGIASTSKAHSYSTNPNATVRSPTLAPPSHPYLGSGTSSARPTPKSSRPPSVASNPVNTAYRHRRSNSLSSTASGHSRAEDGPAAHSRPGSIAGGVAIQSTSPTFEVDAEWPTQEQAAVIRRQKEEEEERREVDEREREAKVQRKIADLEISNSSLLTVNASLERLKLKHVQEIRDLRRKLRESGNLGPLLLQRSAAGLPREGAAPRPQRMSSFTGDDEDEEYEEDEEDEDEEQSWDEVLEADEAFARIAQRLEALVKRARDAVVWQPSKGEGGRVLTQMEVEATWAEGDEDSEGERTGLGISQGTGRRRSDSDESD